VLVIGLHLIKAREPVHLLEVDLSGFEGEIDWRGFTQPLAGFDSSYWQVPYDERPVPGSDGHWCFFFHYLDLGQPLQTPAGVLTLPSETPVPPHLRFIRYEQP
jgi:hypothetical protein